MLRGAFIAALGAVLLAACTNEVEVEPPSRVETAPDLGNVSSTMQVPLVVSLDEVQRALERETPRQLWSMNERRANCIPSQTVRPLGIDIEVTPDIACTIIGEASRGRMRLTGNGNRLTIRFSVEASVRAEDIGDVLAGETATGSADVILNARLSLTPQWQLRADLDLDYAWSNEPGIDFLGQRIQFTRQADEALAGVVRDIERQLEREFARIDLRPMAERAWRQGFAVVSLNAENPPAWLRITPQQLGIEGYRVNGRQLTIDIALQARTETMVGERPGDPEAVALPAMAGDIGGTGVHVAVPVLADYAQLEPVVLRELTELAERGITLPQIGPVDAEFADVTIYATEGRRLALGFTARVTPREGLAARYGEAEGEIWLTGMPYNAHDSAVVSIRDLAIAGDTDRPGVDLLIALFADEQVLAAIEGALVEDFSGDYERIIEDAREAVSELRSGNVTLSLSIDEVRHGRIQATGAGLFLPVEVAGSGQLRARLD